MYYFCKQESVVGFYSPPSLKTFLINLLHLFHAAFCSKLTNTHFLMEIQISEDSSLFVIMNFKNEFFKVFFHLELKLQGWLGKVVSNYSQLKEGDYVEK